MTEHGGTEVLDLRRYLTALRRRKGVIFASVLVMVTTALTLSHLQTPVYEGEARLLVQPGGSARVFESETFADDLDPELVLETEMQLLTSELVRAAVMERLGPVPPVKAERVGQTLLVAVKIESRSPERAAAVANEYANRYVDLGRIRAADELSAVGQELERKLDDLQAEIDALEAQMAGGGNQGSIGALLERRDALVGQQGRFREKLDEIEVETSLASGGARIVGAATVPTTQVKPKPLRNAALAGIGGLIVGLGFASLIEYLNSSVRTKEEVAGVLAGVPVLGVIPAVPKWRGREGVYLGNTLEREAPAMEAYRSLRTSLSLLGVERPLRTLQITSPGAGDGKTTTLVALAALFASMGQRVVALDCDLRRPKLHRAFGLVNELGFTSVVGGQASLAEALQEVPDEKNLMVMPSGPIPPNPSELLSGKPTSELIFALQRQSDLILIDTPPVLPVTDATVMSAWVEGTLLVVSAEGTTRSDLRDAAALLLQAEASLVGAVLNRASSMPGYGYGYEEPTGNGTGDEASRRRGERILGGVLRTAPD